MKYNSSCRKPYRPLTASSAATNTAAMTQTSAGTRSEPGTAACPACAAAGPLAEAGTVADGMPSAREDRLAGVVTGMFIGP